MLSSLHPICLLTRTDAELTTLFHSFYLIEYLREAKDTRVVQRFPQDKPHIDTIESGLKLFIINSLSSATTLETTGKFVVTSSDSSRYFAFFRSYDTKVFVAVSSLPNMSFSRTLFELLAHEATDSIPPILLTLCEIPIFPGAGLQYDVAMTNGTASLKFSSVEQVEDFDIDYIVLSVMTPLMLVQAWEAIVLEKKVLVVSATDSIITACCEFLRRMVAPLVIVNTYVPLLPLQLIDAVDAPFPYLLGTNTKMLKENILDLSDTVVVDLDTRTVTPRLNKSSRPDIYASINLVSKVTQEVSEIMLSPLGEWFHRPTTSAAGAAALFSEQSYVERAARVLQVFKRTTLELICARNCSVKAFWRRAATDPLAAQPAPVDNYSRSSMQLTRKAGSTMMGFNYQDGVCSGFMQLAKELHDENDHVSHFTPTWVEMDQYVLSVYQHADDLPILYILLKDIETVSPCAIEPEGHVFEMVIKDQMSYRFTVTDTESRQKWISTIDRRKNMDFSGNNDDQAFLDQNFSTKMRINDMDANVDLGYSIVGGPAPTAQPLSPTAFTPSANPATWNGYELISKTTKDATDLAPTNEDATGSNHGPSVGSTVTLGFVQPCPPIYPEAASIIAKEDNLFRFEFSRTQTMNYIHQKVECIEFQEIFKELKIKSDVLLGNTFVLDHNLNIVPNNSHPLQSAEEEAGKGMTRTNSDGALDSKKDELTPLPQLQRTNTTVGGTGAGNTAANCAPACDAAKLKHRLSSKMFGGFFKSKTNPEDELANNARLEQEREQEAEAQRSRMIAEKRKASLQSQIFVVTATYRRTQSELNALIVESRQQALQELVSQYTTSLTSGTAQSPYATVTFPMKTILAPFRRQVTSNSRSPKPSPRQAASAIPAQQTPIVRDEPSAAWMDHIWQGLINKSYEDYKRDNPLPDAQLAESEQEMRLSNSDIDEFILDAQRTKSEFAERRQIKELLLSYLTKHHDVNSTKKAYAPFIVVRQVLIGYLHEILNQSGLALECYSKGCLIEQRRLMYCLVQQFLAHTGKLQLLTAQSEPSSPSTNGHAALPNPMRALSNLLTTYKQNSETSTPPVCQFLEASKAISPLVGMQAYRLVLELIYRDLVNQLECVLDASHLTKELELGSFRTFPGSHRNVGSAHQSSARNRVKSSTLLNTDFEYAAGDPKSEAINNAVTCLSIKVERTPCDLSVLLLTELKEILKTYCQSPAGQKNSKKHSHGFAKLKLIPAVIEDLSSTSAYKAFEQHCCILQKVEPNGLTINERVQFWCNIYNTITVHAIISKGSPGSTLLERSAFMRASKYNIGGILHSLLDIEHGILRHSSTKPMLFGPLTVSLSFAERDPRRKQILEEARPNVSFVLCQACVTSPSLVVLKDADMVADEMKYFARRFFHEFVKLDPNNKTITLPGLMRVYWADFGGNRAKVLRVIAQLSGSAFAAELKPYLSPLEGMRAKVEFAKLDWTPLLSISD